MSMKIVILASLVMVGPAAAADYSTMALEDLYPLRMQCELSRPTNADPALRSDYPAEVKADCDAVASSFEAKTDALRGQQPVLPIPRLRRK